MIADGFVGAIQMRKLMAGDRIEVGDNLLHDSWAGKKWFRFVRVTRKFAISDWNEEGAGKFPRVVPEVGLHPSGKRDIWSTVQYSAWRKAEEKSERR